MFSRLMIAGLAVSLLACSPSVPKAEQTALKTEIKQTLKAHIDAINSNGFATAADLYSASPEFSWIEDGRLQYEDRKDIEAAFDQLSEASSVLITDITDIDILDSNNAYIAYNFEQTITFENGPNFAFAGIITAVMTKEDGQWRVIHGHTSTPKPRTNQ